jgi:hypothetical protein
LNIKDFEEKLGAQVLVDKDREHFNGAEEATVLQAINKLLQ